jgi:hypothetical protein
MNDLPKVDLQKAITLLPTCKALLALQDTAFVEQYGARNSRVDLAMLQNVHDFTVRLGAQCNCEEGDE